MGKVLHASESGYFPYCENEDERFEDDPLKKYISSSLTKAMALQWRVREWKYNLFGSYAPPLTTIAGEGMLVPSVKIESEENLVCRMPYEFIGQALLDDGTVQKHFEFEMSIGGGFNLDGDICTIPFEITTPESEITNELLSYPVISEQGELESFRCGFYYIKLFNEILRSGELSSQSFFYAGLDGTCSLIIEPSLYWSYGGTYDTLTGQPL